MNHHYLQTSGWKPKFYKNILFLPFESPYLFLCLSKNIVYCYVSLSILLTSWLSYLTILYFIWLCLTLFFSVCWFCKIFYVLFVLCPLSTPIEKSLVFHSNIFFWNITCGMYPMVSGFGVLTSRYFPFLFQTFHI